jgi:uncharacterized protein YfaQ (DUF2300 family)
MTNHPTRCVAICRRVNRAAFAVVGNDGIYDLHRLASKGEDGHRLLQQAQRLAVAYDANTVVAEPGLLPEQPGVPTPNVTTLPLTAAKARLCGRNVSSHRELAEAIVTYRPELRRLVDGVHFDGPLANDDRWRTVPLFAIALGLAFLKA